MENSKEKQILIKRLLDLANRAFKQNSYTFSDFLSEGELSDFFEVDKDFRFITYTVFGGNDNTQRNMLRFGDSEYFGYEEEFPITCIKISPILEKFGEMLGHRDYLGSLMNLGIERNKLGDIFIKDKHAYLFCNENIAQYIMDNLSKVRHTSVKLSIVPLSEATNTSEPIVKQVMVSSVRIDGVIAKLYNMSRSQVVEAFREHKVFLNGHLCENNSQMLKEGDMISVRGNGRFVFERIDRTTRKEKLMLELTVY